MAMSLLPPACGFVQVLVVHGADDPICEASDASNLAANIAGAQLVQVEGADHWFKGCLAELL